MIFVLLFTMIPSAAFAKNVVIPEEAPFTAITADNGDVLAITRMENVSYTGYGIYENVPYYHITIPEGATEVYVTHPTSEDPFADSRYGSAYGYYANTDSWTGGGMSFGFEDASNGYTITLPLSAMVDTDGDWSADTEGSFVADEDGKVDYAVAVERSDDYSPICFFTFEYGAAAEPEEPAVPFLSIKIDGNEITSDDIEYKGIFELGDYDVEDMDGYDYVHKVPYYHVTVPCGTDYVDVTYGAETNIMNYGKDAYGYKTNLQADTVSSATVRGTTFKDAYTKNADNTQTVKTPVKGYTFDAEGKGHAITLEENDAPFAAVCLFTFEYDGENHVFVDGVCSCGEKEPINLEIPDNLNIEKITPVTLIEQGEDITFSLWGVDSTVPSYVATVPEGTTTVSLTFKAGTHPAPYGGGKISGSMISSSYNEDSEEWTYSAGGTESNSVQDENGLYTIELNAADMIRDGKYYGAYDANYNTQYVLTFKYPEGAHEHSYDEGVVTTEPTCTEKGVKTFTCTGCKEGTEGHSYTVDVKAKGHSYDSGTVTTPATCIADGIKTFVCQNEGCLDSTEGHTKTEKIGKTGHKYDEGVVTVEPSCIEEGVKTYTCQNEGCLDTAEGHTKTESLPVTDHNYNGDKTCDDCGYTDNSPAKDENGAYQIGTREELLWFAEEVNSGNTKINAVLTADIEVTDNWPGIGNYENAFGGTFDGQNHTVTLNGGVWGLFGYAMGTWDGNFNIKTAVEIKNVIVDGTCKNTPLVHTAGYVRITNCINKADVIGTGSCVAGILGSPKYTLQYNSIRHTNVLIEDCINEGNIQGANKVGGILGETVANTKVNKCANSGDISGTSEIGGIVGYMQEAKGTCEVRNSYNTGKVSGTSKTAGIIGNAYNGAEIVNCYNSGEAKFALLGYIYNNTVAVTNSYYRGGICSYSVPNVIYDGNLYTGNRGTAMTSAEMSSEELATLLGDAFKASCPSPVLTNQDAHDHTFLNNICIVCKQGNQNFEEYAVTFSAPEGCVINGDTAFKPGNDYKFSVTILDGYYKGDNFGVYVNSTKVEAVDGIYTVVKPEGPFYVYVKDVKKMEGVVSIALPSEGHGYRVNPCEGFGNTVESGKEFKFTVDFVEGFKAGEGFAVKTNGELLTADENGVYTIENIIKRQEVTVEGVDIIPSGNSVVVGIEITSGENEFMYSEATDTIMMDKYMDIPYFDISLYGLERFYYNPYCYLDEEGNIRGQQKVGTRESAYDVVTTMHAFIYMTEVYYLGYDEAEAGLGYSYMTDTDEDGISDFDEAVSWTQGAGSSFMNLWGLGSNLNYHINYEYPLAYPGWGSTSDQQALNDWDRISVHMIKGNASGSGFGLFVANDDNETYDRNEERDTTTVKQGESVTLTHYLATQGDHYTTAFVKGADKALYWVEQGEETADIGDWNHENGFGTISAENFKTDADGKITIDTTGIEPGVYYIATSGGFAKGSGNAGSDGFVSRGSEFGPAYFTLIVEEGENPGLEEGDLNGDGAIDTTDASTIISYYYDKVELTEEQLAVADVNKDGVVDTIDASLIISLYYGKIDSFPVVGK